MPMRRLFIALSPPDAVKQVLAGLQTPLRNVRWTPLHQLHVTLRFLGDVETTRIDDLVARLGGIQVQSFLLPLEGVGAFPPKNAPRVLWCGVGQGHPRLHQLRQRVDDTVLAVGVEADLRTFHPHVTLARCDPTAAAGANQWLRTHREFAGPSFLVDAFELFASELTPSGAEHTLIQRFELGK